MRKQLAVLTAAAAMTVGGIGFYSTNVRADDPAARQAADDMGRPQSPAANDVRDVISETTSASVQGKFEDAAKRFTDADRKRLGDDFKDNATLRDKFTQFNNDWKAKYNEDFDSKNIEKALSDPSVRIYQGDYTDRARTAGERMSPSDRTGDLNSRTNGTSTGSDRTDVAPSGGTRTGTSPGSNSGAFSGNSQPQGAAPTNGGVATGAGTANTGTNATGAGVSGSANAGSMGAGASGNIGGASGSAQVGSTDTSGARTASDRNMTMNDKDLATIYIPSSHNMAPIAVCLRKESGIGNSWKIDVPDSANAQALSDNLSQHVTMIVDQKSSWPADVNDAYRMVTHHVLTALSDTGGVNRTGTDRLGNTPTPR